MVVVAEDAVVEPVPVVVGESVVGCVGGACVVVSVTKQESRYELKGRLALR